MDITHSRPRLFGHSKASVLLWAEACNPARVRAIRFPPRAAARRVSLTGSTRPRALLDRPDRPRGQVRRLAHSTGGPSWGTYVGSLSLGPRGAPGRKVSKSQHLYSRLYVGLAPLRALIRHEKPIKNPNEGIVYPCWPSHGLPGGALGRKVSTTKKPTAGVRGRLLSRERRTSQGAHA